MVIRPSLEPSGHGLIDVAAGHAAAIASAASQNDHLALQDYPRHAIRDESSVGMPVSLLGLIPSPLWGS